MNMIFLVLCLLSSETVKREDIELTDKSGNLMISSPAGEILIIYSRNREELDEYLWMMDAQCDKFHIYLTASILGEDGFYPLFKLVNAPDAPAPGETQFLFIKAGSNESTWKTELPDVMSVLKDHCLDTGKLLQTLGTEYVILQQHENACGARALENLFLRKNLSIDSVVIDDALDSGPDGNGTSLLKIKQFCNEINIKSDGFAGSYKDLLDEAPVILFVDNHHFVVASKVFEDGAIIVDPAIGRQYWSKEELIKRWTSNVYFSTAD